MNNKFYTNFKLGELFCGPGGIGLGAKLASLDRNLKIEHAWATDYDSDTCETFRHNLTPDNPDSVICADVRKLDFKRLENISPVDGLAFGFPCNDFSIVGEQKGIDGVYGPLYSYCVKAINYFKPKWFLAENVGGLRNSNDGNAFLNILDEFKREGYKLTPHLYKFEKYGIPQARHRIIIIGIREDLDVTFKVPSPNEYFHIDNTAKTAIEAPPIAPGTPNNELTSHARAVIERLKYIKPGENAFTAEIPEHLQLNVKGAKISQIYKRLDPNKPSYTVTGSGGGGTHVYHWSENRALTNRERARLQTFPDDYFFCGSKESVRKQVGMAVPANGAKIIFDALLNSFLGLEYQYVEPNIKLQNKLLSPKIAYDY